MLQSRRSMGRACSIHGNTRNAFRVLLGKTEAKTPVKRPKRGWENKIKMDLKEIGQGGMD
jgi:hypothetical protein